MNETYLIGLDFGTDSVRALLVRGSDGAEVATAVFAYPRWRDGLYCNAAAQQFRQHPLDHLEGLEYVIRACLQQAGPAVAAQVKAIGLGATGSSPLPVNREGTPLALLPAFADNPNAMVILWKDHTAIREAAEINAHAAHTGTPYLQYAGGIYSSEWFWAKLLHVLRHDEAVRAQTWSWVEHCDWLPFVLTGGNDVTQMKRSVCAAGHKALWAADWGGLPPAAFWESLDPLLAGFSSHLYTDTCTADQPAGTLSPAWAAKLGLSESVIVTTGALDAHVGAVGGQIAPYFLSKVMGTSTCDMLVAPAGALGQKKISGICGQVPGSVIPGLIGMEAGQSAFGDTYAWLRDLLAWPLQWLGEEDKDATRQLRARLTARILPELNRQAALLPVEEEAPLALDWLNGRRTPDADPLLKAAIAGLTLGTDAVGVFRTLAESTCFGARKIVDRFATEGVPVKGLIGVGGIVKKSPFIMQMLADVLEMPIRAHAGEQTCAAGAAMFAATAAGLYPSVEVAMQAMGRGFECTYTPNGERAAIYRRRYAQYERFGYLATALYSPR